MKSWLIDILQSLVTEPDLLIINDKTDELGVLFTVSTTNKKDLGMLIGRNGEHVNALRILLRTKGHIQGIKASLKIEG